MNISELIIGIILAFIIIIPFVSFATHDGIITFERPYLNEYKQCRAENLELQKEVQCPPVQCNCGAVGILWSIIGFLFIIIGGVIYWYSLYDRNNEKTN